MMTTPKRILVLLAMGFTVHLAFLGAALAAEIRVLSDGPLEPALVKIGEAFRRDTGNQVTFVFAPSPVIQKRVTSGEMADVLIVQPDFVEELAKAGKVALGERPVISRVGLGLATRADTPGRDISTPETFKQALLNADSLVFNNVASGNYFAKVLDRLGIADAIKDKIVRMSPAEVFNRVLHSKGNDIAVGTITLIMATKGLKLIGALPAEFQSYIIYTAAPMTNAEQPETAKAFIRFLASPQSKDAFAAAGAN